LTVQAWLFAEPALAAHAAPPLAEAVVILYAVDCVPAPHVLEQVDQEP